ncbi:MAG: clan AA aspartic protease [Elusimicrobia bacterium]|nr:clan AA aspartic protease [Elusimicrobiota bacterium]
MLRAALLLAVHGWADTVVLKNGNEMEGIVQSANAREVVLDMGFGTTSLPRRSVAKIVRSKAPERERILRDHRRNFFDSGRWVPPSRRELFERYQEVGRAREKATDAKKRREGLAEEEARLTEELPSLDFYPRIEAWKRLQEIQATLPSIERDMQAYFMKFKEFETAAGAAPAAAEAEEREFDQRLREAIAEMDKDFDRDAIVSRRSGAHLIVQAVLDGRVPATLMVDTGASLTTITPEVAAKLTPVPGSESAGLTTVADGRQVKVKVFRVGTLEVGRSKEGLVAVAVMPAPGPGIDGLLGMSFLEHFAVQVDGPTGRLMLNRLK